MSSGAEDPILREVEGVLDRSLGLGYSGGIGPETRFFADLGLASIDAVVLGEALERHYGRTLPFAELMAEIGTRADRDLLIGDLVAFLRRQLRD